MSYGDYLIGKTQGYPNVTEALCYLTGVSHPIKGSSTKRGNNPQLKREEKRIRTKKRIGNEKDV